MMSKMNRRLLEKYNSYRRRVTIQNISARKLIFKSFQRTLYKWLPNTTESLILDVACGEGSFLFYLKELGYSKLYGIDFSRENVEICHQIGLDFVQYHDALKIDELYPPDFFDEVIVMDFLEHLPKQSTLEFLEMVTKKMKPGGTIIIQTPNMGSIFGLYHRYNDLSHEFGLTEKSVIDLMLMAGYKLENIEIEPAWNAATFLGYLREIYLRCLHFSVFIAEDISRPKIPTKNLLIRGKKI